MTAPRHGDTSDNSGAQKDTDRIASTLSQRCSSLARRILSGAGMATMVAHSMISAHESPEEWTCDLQAHGITASGRFLVALRSHPTQALCQVPAGLPTDVRLEISKDAPEPAIRLLAASLHVLATVTWLTPDQIDHLLATDVLPSEVSIIAGFDDALIGVIAPHRAILHDAMGSTEIDIPALINDIPADEVFPSAEDELSALDIVASLGNLHLSQLCDGVRKKTVLGCSCWSRATHHACPHTVGRVFCADIDRTGLTLMYVNPDQTGAMFIPLEQDATSLTELKAAVARLPLSSDPVRPTRV
ncbi:hypothetical protein [Cutibacterium namnetense]|uniref:Uncharacterized protein n=2 Tax=Cutibacterium namnetense TaxID=1574624 RepID=F9NX87_9ACTN|nr:hypothetical protein [Cutibacterium namnetense]EGR95427.1 hypothetical protein HMPREF1162_2065 [ [[Propionibacterium] namnetense SK182B-JCVI]REB70982.1 hypothetical protein CP880_04600 [Cutibacterium namnetense]TKW71765.1 MAG: hypothetical protein DI580_06960 [Cutibacterium acnes]